MTALETSPLCLDLPAVTLNTEVLPGRQRQLEASIVIPRPVEQVWQILTDYEALADFIPSLKVSRLLPHPEGKIHLEQVGAQRFLKLNFQARVVLAMEEDYPRSIRFQMVEGDFKDFAGSWELESQTVEVEGRISPVEDALEDALEGALEDAPDDAPEDALESAVKNPVEEMAGTRLIYRVKVWPKLTMPIQLVERRLNLDLPRNLVAIYQQAIARTPLPDYL